MGAAAMKNKGRVNAVTGIHLGVVNEEIVRKTATELKLVTEGAELEPLETVLVRLALHFAEVTPKQALGDCDTCHGKSPMTLDACPFCGSVDDPAAKEAKPPVAAVPAPAPAAPVVATAPKASKTKPKKEEAQTMGKGKTGAAAKVTSIVKDDTKASSAIVTERELDEKIKKVRDLKSATAVSFWHLGVAIKDIYDSQAWKQRNDENGKPKYKGFDPFVHHELGMTPQSAYKHMQTATKYSEDQCRAFGSAKLGLLLEAPEVDQPRILKQIEGGASKREVEQQVRQARKERKVARKATKHRDGRAMPKGGKKQKATITVANVIGRKTIKLFAKPAGYKLGDALDGAKRAKKLSDTPFGIHDLENDVKQFITIQESPTGELVIVIETKRTES